ncbi:hypothetical protein FGB62_174g013 [Gracilaria domingensis]|nr:hypothetical protein FGB62_174g013 [Gracilaria domingensis]
MYKSLNNHCSTIPDWAEVEVIGTQEALTEFERTVPDTFKNFTFDDPQYYRDVLLVDSETDASGGLSKVILNINVEGAQHGSAPDQNRLEGSTMEEDGSLKLEIDIRYALDHHSMAWDGVTECELDGKSVFGGAFARLLEQFNQSHPQLGDVSFTPKTVFGPDIRVPETNENFLKAEEAFRKVMKTDPPGLAIGGGTDAKGNLWLLAMGPLFGTNMGNPIVYWRELQ